MAEPPHVSNWEAAISELVCPKCGATNRPGVIYVELYSTPGIACCLVCAATFIPAPSHGL